MTQDLVVSHLNESLESAYKKMLEARVRHLPIVNDSGEVVGVMSDRDFQRSMWPLEWSRSDRTPSAALFSEEPVSDYMSSPVKTVDISESLGYVAQVMSRDKISAVIVTECKKAVGILTTADILRVLMNDSKDMKSFKDRVLGWAF